MKPPQGLIDWGHGFLPYSSDPCRTRTATRLPLCHVVDTGRRLHRHPAFPRPMDARPMASAILFRHRHTRRIQSGLGQGLLLSQRAVRHHSTDQPASAPRIGPGRIRDCLPGMGRLPGKPLHRYATQQRGGLSNDSNQPQPEANHENHDQPPFLYSSKCLRRRGPAHSAQRQPRQHQGQQQAQRGHDRYLVLPELAELLPLDA